MENVIVSAKVDEGLSVATQDGRPLSLAIIDADGSILQSGREVTKAVFSAAVDAYDAFWQGNGHLTTVRMIEAK